MESSKNNDDDQNSTLSVCAMWQSLGNIIGGVDGIDKQPPRVPPKNSHVANFYICKSESLRGIETFCGTMSLHMYMASIVQKKKSVSFHYILQSRSVGGVPAAIKRQPYADREKQIPSDFA